MAAKTKAAAAVKKKTHTPVKKPGGRPKKTTEKTQEFRAVDFCGVKLTKLRRDFILHYCTPGQPCFHNAMQAALKSGYSESVAKSEIYNIIQDPDIQKIIRANEALAHRVLHASAMRALEIKQRRAFYDPNDYYEEKEITIPTKYGDTTKTVMALKPMDKMTPEQRLCIDGIDIKGQASLPVYVMADREKNLNDIIRIDSELSKTVADTSEEETREIIMERITVRETKRAMRPADIEYEIIDRPSASEAC